MAEIRPVTTDRKQQEQQQNGGFGSTSLDLGGGGVQQRQSSAPKRDPLDDIADMSLNLPEPVSPEALPDIFEVRAGELMKSDHPSDREKGDKLGQAADRMRQRLSAAGAGIGGVAGGVAGGPVGAMAGTAAGAMMGPQGGQQSTQPQPSPQQPAPNQQQPQGQQAGQGQQPPTLGFETGMTDPEQRQYIDRVSQKTGMSPDDIANMTPSEINEALRMQLAEDASQEAQQYRPMLEEMDNDRLNYITESQGAGSGMAIAAQNILRKRQAQQAAMQRKQARNMMMAKQGVEPTQVGAGLAYDPYRGEVMGEAPAPEPTTLEPGQELRDAKGNLIARNETDGKKTIKVGPGEVVLDREGNVVGRGPERQSTQAGFTEQQDRQFSHYKNELTRMRERRDELRHRQQKASQTGSEAAPLGEAEQQELRDLEQKIPVMQGRIEGMLAMSPSQKDGQRQEQGGEPVPTQQSTQDTEQAKEGEEGAQKQQQEREWSQQDSTITLQRQDGSERKLDLATADDKTRIPIARGTFYDAETIRTMARKYDMTPRRVVMLAYREAQQNNRAENKGETTNA